MSLATQEVKTKANKKTIIFSHTEWASGRESNLRVDKSEVGFFLFIAKVKKRNEKKKKLPFQLTCENAGQSPWQLRQA